MNCHAIGKEMRIGGSRREPSPISWKALLLSKVQSKKRSDHSRISKKLIRKHKKTIKWFRVYLTSFFVRFFASEFFCWPEWENYFPGYFYDFVFPIRAFEYQLQWLIWVWICYWDWSEAVQFKSMRRSVLIGNSFEYWQFTRNFTSDRKTLSEQRPRTDRTQLLLRYPSPSFCSGLLLSVSRLWWRAAIKLWGLMKT